MDLLLQILLLFGLCLGGEALGGILPFPFPGSVMSMLLLLFLLFVKWIKLHQIEKVSNYLLQNMAFFFVPLGAELLKYTHLLRSYWVQILFICLISTVLTFAASAYTVQWLIALQNKKKERTPHA